MGAGREALAARLARLRRLARLVLFWEGLWPRLWPLLGVLGAFLLLALLDVPPLLPAWPHLLLLLGFAGLAGFAAWRGLRGFRAPGEEAAARRLEQASGLAHRPLAALADQPADTDPASLALWRAHQARAAAQLRALRVGRPHPGLPARDPRALRAGLVLALLAGFAMAGGEAGGRLRRALIPAFGIAPAAPGLRLEAWVTPPAYTGAAPIFLDSAGGAATVPAGSRLQVALAGGPGGVPELLSPGGTTAFRALDAGSFAAEAELASGGRLAVRRGGAELVAWTLAVQADAPPNVIFTEPPGRSPRGLAIRLPWRADDDWGLVGVQAELRLKPRPAAAPMLLDIPLPAGASAGPPRQAQGTAQPDLTAHPWAGLEVEVRLLARDGAGQQGHSPTATLLLPERSFNHPVARRLVALRRALTIDPGERLGARQELEAISRAPEAFEHDTVTFLALRAARSRLVFDRRQEAVAEVQEILWETALALEEGRDGRTQRALQQAREALREALDQAERLEQRDREQPPGEQRDPAQQQERDAQRAELQRRIQELREAIRRHLEALAERLQRENAEAPPPDQQRRMLNQREVDRHTRRMEQAAREGRPEDARRELAELEEMLRALEEGRVGRAENPQRQQQRQRGQQQMGVVQDMVRRQGDMLDRSHQRAEAGERAQAEQRRQQQQRQRSFRWPPDPSPPPAAPQAREPAQGQQESSQDGRRQRALRRALGELMQQFGDLTGEVPEALGRADQAMREAQEALGEGQDARGAQQRAMRALQEGGRQMAQAMQRQFGPGQEGEDEGDGDDMAGDRQPGGAGQDQARGQGEGRDPLGRRSQDVDGSADNGADTRVPDEAELLRTRRLQDELRRRGAERERPAEELDYIDRLLKRF